MALSDDISSQINDVQSKIDSIISDANGLTDEMENAIGQIDRNFKLDKKDLVPFGEGITVEDPPNFPSSWESYLNDLTSRFDLNTDNIDNPVLDAIGQIRDQTFRDPGTAPGYTAPARPDAFLGVLPTAPDLASVALPDKPDTSLPDAPVFDQITLPDPPDYIDIPAFAGVRPDDIQAPALQGVSFNEQAYESELKDAAEAWLQDVIDNGGTGLDPDVEAGIYNRLRAREISAFHDNIERAADEFAASGFPRPTGALRARRDKIREDFQQATEDLARKIAEDQAKLAQENSHFAITTSLQHEAVMLQHHNNVYNRLLEYAVAVASNAQAHYNLVLSQYNAKWEGYKAEAQVHSELIRAASLQVEKYRAEIDAERARGDIDNLKLERYKTLVSAVEVAARIYSVEVDSAKTETEIEALKLQQYRAEIDGFSASVNAKQQEYDAYKANISGELAKVEAFKANVDASNSYNQGKIAQIEADKARIDGVIQTNNAKLQEYQSQIDAFKSKGDIVGSIIDSTAKLYLSDHDAYKARMDMNIDKAKIRLGELTETSRHRVEGVREYNKIAMAQGQLIVDHLKAGLSSTASTVGYFSNIASSLASQINTISSISSSEDVSA